MAKQTRVSPWMTQLDPDGNDDFANGKANHQMVNNEQRRMAANLGHARWQVAAEAGAPQTHPLQDGGGDGGPPTPSEPGTPPVRRGWFDGFWGGGGGGGGGNDDEDPGDGFGLDPGGGGPDPIYIGTPDDDPPRQEEGV